MGGAVKGLFGVSDAPMMAAPDQNLVDPFAQYRAGFASNIQGQYDATNQALNTASQQGITNAGLQQGMADVFAQQANANMAGAQNVGNQLQSFLAGGASGVLNDPVYQAMQAQGEQGISRRFAAGGKGMSGNEMQGLMQGNMGLANQFYNQQLGNLQSSIGALSNLGSVANQALGMGYNAQSGALSGVTQAYQNAAANQGQQLATGMQLGGANANVGAGYQAQLAQQQANTQATQANNAFGTALMSAAVGGIAGGVGGAMGNSLFGGPTAPAGGASSDPRLKKNVKLIGTYPNGLPKYEFEYTFKDGRFIGTMSTDVRKVYPEAVSVDDKGFDRVDYDMLDIRMEEI